MPVTNQLLWWHLSFFSVLRFSESCTRYSKLQIFYCLVMMNIWNIVSIFTLQKWKYFKPNSSSYFDLKKHILIYILKYPHYYFKQWNHFCDESPFLPVYSCFPTHTFSLLSIFCCSLCREEIYVLLFSMIC